MSGLFTILLERYKYSFCLKIGLFLIIKTFMEEDRYGNS